MRKSRRIALWGALLLVTLAVSLFGVLSMRSQPTSLDTLPGQVGHEEIRQLFGREDAAAPPEAGSEAPADAMDDASLRSASLRGQVVRPNGEPAPGAVVTAQRAESDEIHEALADSGGMFGFEDLPPGLYVVEAVAVGFGPALAIGVRPRATPLRLVLQGGRDVYGIAIHGEEPVPGAVLHLGGPGLFPQRRVVADATGRFRISGLRQGTYEVAATAPELGTGFGGRLIVDEPGGPGSADERIEVRLERARPQRIEVLDRRSRELLPGVVLTIAEAPLHVLSFSHLLRDGTLDIDFLPRGTYFIRVRAPGYLPWEGEVRLGARTAPLQIRLSQGAVVRGDVRDEAGNPIGGVSLSALVETDAGARWELRRSIFDDLHRLVRPDGTLFWVPSFGYVSRRDGQFELAGIPAGTVRVLAEAPGRATAVSAPMILQADAVYEPLSLVLQEGRRIRGRVEDRAGAGIAGAVVTVRPMGVPSWAPGLSATTGTSGMFLLEDVPGVVALSVRHPDFASLEMDLDVPFPGRDDLILRLSGEQLLSMEGRVFTQRGAPATGAVVWMMRGRAELPVCRAIVGPDAFFRATHCSAAPERILVSHPEHAPLIGELGGVLEARDWRLGQGGEIDLISQRTPSLASLSPLFQLPGSLWPRPEFDLDRWSRVVVPRMAPGPYELRCRAEGFEDHVVRVDVEAGRRVEAICPSLDRRMRLPLFVIDRMGAPVPDALVFIDGIDPPLRELTDSRGRVMFESAPGVWAVVEAMHEDWGRGRMDLYVPWREPSDPLRISLEDPIGNEVLLEELADWGIAAVQSNRSVIVDTIARGGPAAESGLRRHDRLMWARPVSESRYSVGVRRAGDILTFELVRAPSR